MKIRTRHLAGLAAAVATSATLVLGAVTPALATAHGHAARVAPMARTAAAPPAVHAGPRVYPRGAHPDTVNSECQATNHNLCWTNKNGTLSAGNIISGSAQSGNSNQHWLFFSTTACGDGFVHKNDPPGPGTGPCPFANGSGLNTIYDGHQIVTICLTDHTSWCQAVNNPQVNGNLTLQSNTATGTNWVIDANDSAATFVNKSRTDVLGTGARTTTDGTLGDQLHAFVNNFNDPDVQWVTLLGV